MIQRLGIVIGCLFFHSKMVTIILQEVILISIIGQIKEIKVIKDFNALIDNKIFFDQPVKNKQEMYEKLVEMSRNNDYATGNLLD